MNLEEIKNLINETNTIYLEDENLLEENGYEVKFVYENEWGEGALANVERVFKIKKDGESCFIMVEGYYNSYVGSEYESCKEVKPYIFTETRYK